MPCRIDYNEITSAQLDDNELFHLLNSDNSLQLKKIKIPNADLELYCDVSTDTNHIRKFCNNNYQKCKICGSFSHNSLICKSELREKVGFSGLGSQKGQSPSGERGDSRGEATTSLVSLSAKEKKINNAGGLVLLQTFSALVTAKPKGNVQLRCMLDGGANKSFILREVVELLDLKVVDKEALVIHTFGSEAAEKRTYDIVEIMLQNVQANKKIKIQAVVIDSITSARIQIPSKFIRNKIGELMNLRRWATNSITLHEAWKRVNVDCREPSEEAGVPLKILGIIWDNVNDNLSIDIKRFEKLSKLVKITKRVILSACGMLFDPIGIMNPFAIRMKMLLQTMFANNCKYNTKRITGNLIVDELFNAEKYWVRCVQQTDFKIEYEVKQCESVSRNSELFSLNPVVSQDGLLCLGGRLQKSDFNFYEKYPLILPFKSRFSQLLIMREHQRLHHAGVCPLHKLERLIGFFVGDRPLNLV
ncbi:integrase catalytic domain-containing protein [Trichonephila clavata]|uniref:Integrase catalytic domain-containing protein n=1 Tax=Trichonephila clavata TaxID=2740835 RepID=A0A8X6IPX6_TRICU|nr:integrase catalytic domain-containing protein [Trichonephila clavata]